MPRLLAVLLMSFALASGAAAGPQPSRPILETHLLKIEGKLTRLVRIQINGVEVVRGGATQPVPIPVTRVLRDGENAMALQFVSDPSATWRVSIERRRTDERPREVVRYEAAAGESAGAVATRSVQFRVTLPKYPPLDLTDADRRAVLSLIAARHAALNARDAARAEAAYARSLAELGLVYPEGVRLWRSLQQSVDRRLLASPDFKMKPLRTGGLVFTQEGRLLRVSRADGGPVIESEEVVLDQTVRGPTGATGTAKVKIGMQPRAMYFARHRGEWYLAVAFAI